MFGSKVRKDVWGKKWGRETNFAETIYKAPSTWPGRLFNGSVTDVTDPKKKAKTQFFQLFFLSEWQRMEIRGQRILGLISDNSTSASTSTNHQMRISAVERNSKWKHRLRESDRPFNCKIVTGVAQKRRRFETWPHGENIKLHELSWCRVWHWIAALLFLGQKRINKQFSSTYLGTNATLLGV